MLRASPVVPEGGAVPVVRARVYDDAGSLGPTGVTEYGLPPADAQRALDSGATLTFTLRDAYGSVLKSFTENYPATFYIQRSASDFFDGAPFAGDEGVTVSVSSGAAFVCAAVADNITNDPSMQIARRLP